MATVAGELNTSTVEKSAPAKTPKTGGRVKQPLDPLLAEARVRDKLASRRDDTVLPEELAAIILCVSVAELADLRKPPEERAGREGG